MGSGRRILITGAIKYPIPGTTKMHRLEENLGGAEVELSPEELRDINVALDALDIDETHF
jgi:aryl-alcohol dehydrogenase-like predicted oxidoreductase